MSDKFSTNAQQIETLMPEMCKTMFTGEQHTKDITVFCFTNFRTHLSEHRIINQLSARNTVVFFYTHKHTHKSSKFHTFSLIERNKTLFQPFKDRYPCRNYPASTYSNSGLDILATSAMAGRWSTLVQYDTEQECRLGGECDNAKDNG